MKVIGILLAGCLALAAVVLWPAPPSPPALVPASPAHPRTVHLLVDGADRSYLLQPAVGGEGDTPPALLVVLHQDDAVVRTASVTLGLEPLRHQGVTLAYASGKGGSWNAGACCGEARRGDVDDVAFVSAVLDDVGRQTPVDPARRAVLGYSSGGMLLERLLCTAHPALAAAVEVAASLETPCRGTVSLPPLLALHGARDGTVRLDRPTFVPRLGAVTQSVSSSLATLTSAGGCPPAVRSTGVRTTRTVWRPCRGGGSVEAVVVLAAGHRWQDMDAASRCADWLLQRLRPSRPSAR